MVKKKRYKYAKRNDDYDRCGICQRKKARLVTYHISYSPEKTIRSCVPCNKREYLIRTGKINPQTWNDYRIIELAQKHNALRGGLLSY